MSSCDQLKIQGLFWRAIFFIPPSFSCPFYLAAQVQEWRFWGGCTAIFPSPLNQGYTEPNLQDHEGSNKAAQKLEEMWMMENSERNRVAQTTNRKMTVPVPSMNKDMSKVTKENQPRENTEAKLHKT